jgi:hypothetical protein
VGNADADVSPTALPFDGPNLTVPDLRVGEIRALRTFRLAQYGRLYPARYGPAGPWQDGANTARCHYGHTPAAPGCMCGFWAYGTHRAARDFIEARRVLAVVACWGRVVPGTRGLRAQHARIEAIWVSAWVSRRLVRQLRERYPSATFYRSKRFMLIRHRLTRLDSYEPVLSPREERQQAFCRHPVVRPFLMLQTAAWWLACGSLLLAGAMLIVHALL